MASESIKKVQGKLFRGEGAIKQSQQPDRASPGLAIHIPKPASPQPAPNPPPKLSKPPPDVSPKDHGAEGDQPTGRYRDRVIELLGGHYHGVEKYRLAQDDQKERHWKRWGPYLSERQWVSLVNFPTRSQSITLLCRPPSVKIILPMEMHGVTSRMSRPDLVPIDGVRTVSPESLITTSDFASRLLYGMARIPF